MKKYPILFLIIISIILGIIIEPNIRSIKTDGVVDFSVNNEGGSCVLNYDSDTNVYSLLKVSQQGKLIKKVNLDTGSNNSYVYKNIEADSEGNFYLLKQQIDFTSDKYGVVNEQILKYDNNGNFLNNIANIDFSKKDNLPKSSFIISMQLINDELKIVCRNENSYQVLLVDKEGNEKAEMQKEFNIMPDTVVDKDEAWVSDIAVSLDSSVAYIDKKGRLYIMNGNNEFENVTPSLGNNIVPTMLSIDQNDNFYFTDLNTKSFQKFNFKDKKISLLYNKDSIINESSKIKFEDLECVRAFSNGDFYGIKKSIKDDSYVIFGQEQKTTNSLDQSFWERVLTVACISIVISLILVALYWCYVLLKQHYSIVKKVMLNFTFGSFMLLIGLTCFVLYFLIQKQTDSFVSNQKFSLGFFASDIDGDAFNNTNFLSDYNSSEYVKIKNIMQRNISKMNELGSDVIVYKMINNEIYSSIESSFLKEDLSQDNFLHQLSSHLPSVPISYSMTSTLYNQYKKMFTDMKKSPSTFQDYSYQDKNGKWIGVFAPIVNTKNEVTGFIETRFAQSKVYQALYDNIILFVVVGVLIFAILIFVYVYLILKRIMKPLHEIRKGTEILSRGEFQHRLSETSKDEFADICRSINNVSETFYSKIYNLVLLNGEYVKYSPNEMFMLLDKNKITDIVLKDKTVKNFHILNVFFDNFYKINEDKRSKSDYLSFIENNIDLMFRVVQDNNGVISSFDGLKMTVIFKNNALDAIKTSMQFKEIIEEDAIKPNMNMILYSNETLIGVVGNEDRISIITISEMMIIASKIAEQMNYININHLATQEIINNLDGENVFPYRFIGKINVAYSNTPLRLYEFTGDEYLYDKNLYLQTKDIFEDGVKNYIDGNFGQARKCFSDVLFVNKEDKLAMAYLKLCDKYEDRNIQGWNGLLFEV